FDCDWSSDVCSSDLGFANLPLIVKKLTEFGMPSSKPAAVISKATTREQRTVTATLETIEKRVIEANLPTPALIVVGDVVKLHERSEERRVGKERRDG